jgi:DNA-directed RNA polymerase specialized sigma24 family protein
MLWNREDAEDATQEILIRIVTHLSQFGFRSRLKTWAYRLAVNYILDVKKSAIERLHLSFERFADDLEPSAGAPGGRGALGDRGPSHQSAARVVRRLRPTAAQRDRRPARPDGVSLAQDPVERGHGFPRIQYISIGRITP